MDYTNRKERGGIQPKEIHKITKIISLRTIQEHLSVLLRERKVEKRKDNGHKTEYRATDSYQISKLNFAHQMRRIRNRMIYAIYQKPRTFAKDITRGNIAKNPFSTPASIAAYMTWPSPLDTLREPEVEFYEKMSSKDVTISTYYCQTKFGRAEKEERHMFEFVNRVGAFITYIFFESLKALSEKSNDDNTKTPITKLIIDNAIDLNGIFNDFCYLFEKQSPEEISKAFKNVYPTAEILEKYWSDRLQLSERFKKEQARAERDRREKILKGKGG